MDTNKNITAADPVTRSARERKKTKSLLGSLNSWLHLWLGLGSGIVVFVVCLSGTVFVFADEIIDLRAGKALQVETVSAQRLNPEQQVAAFKEQVKGNHPFYMVLYKDPRRTTKIASEDKNDHLVFSWVDPYSGQVLKTDGAYWFFFQVAHIHSQLLFHEPGGLIVEIATWIFLIELITGLVLWFPKKWNKAGRQMCFQIKWRGRWRRVNYDLHNVLGFYSLLPSIMLTITGLIIVNHLLSKTVHKALGGETGMYPSLRKFGPPYDSAHKHVPLQAIADDIFASKPSIQQLRMTLPPNDSVTYHMAVAGEEIGLRAYSGRLFLINRYSGKEIDIPPALMKAEVIEKVNMNLHLGFWAGWVGKTITFIVGLICTSLPITGFLIWWGRRKKNSRASTPQIRSTAMAD